MGGSKHQLAGRPLESVAASLRPRDVAKPLAGLRILVVDDEPGVLRVVRVILTRAGAEVCEAGSAGAAFAALQTFRPQLVVSDINMPVEDGYSLVRRIRALEDEGARLIPAIALTAGSSGGRVEALRAGFSFYLSKPVTPTELVDAAASLLVNHGSGC